MADDNHRRLDGTVNPTHFGKSGLFLEDGSRLAMHPELADRLRNLKAIFRRVVIKDIARVKIFGALGSRNDTLSVYIAGPTDDHIIVTTGCFSGTLDEYEAEVARKTDALEAMRSRVRMEQLDTIAHIRHIASRYEVEPYFELVRDPAGDRTVEPIPEPTDEPRPAPIPDAIPSPANNWASYGVPTHWDGSTSTVTPVVSGMPTPVTNWRTS